MSVRARDVGISLCGLFFCPALQQSVYGGGEGQGRGTHYFYRTRGVLERKMGEARIKGGGE